MSRWYGKLVVLFVLIFSLILASTAAAQSPGGIGFGMRPQDATKGYFSFKVQPGDVIEDALFVINSDTKPVKLNIRPVVGHTALTGGVSFPDKEVEELVNWVDLPDKGEITLEGHSDELEVPEGELPPNMRLMNFKVTVPADTPPGEYVLGFLATKMDVEATEIQTQEETSSGGFKVKIVPQMGLPIYLTVGEPNNCSVDITSVDKAIKHGVWNLKMNFSNTGNVHFKGEGLFKLTSLDSGETAVERPFKMGYFVMGDSVAYPLNINPLPEAGKYKLEITLNSSEVEGCGAVYTEEELEITDQDAKEAQKQQKEIDDAKRRSQGEESASDQLIRLIVDNIAIVAGCLVVLALAFVGVIVLLIVLDRKKKKARRAAKSASKAENNRDVEE